MIVFHRVFHRSRFRSLLSMKTRYLAQQGFATLRVRDDLARVAGPVGVLDLARQSGRTSAKNLYRRRTPLIRIAKGGTLCWRRTSRSSSERTGPTLLQSPNEKARSTLGSITSARSASVAVPGSPRNMAIWDNQKGRSVTWSSGV